ncbi:MFS transporter [Rhodococcus olei]|uniref:MFS transporter n=1 Tax=Rhodococcus olei TaxID=2161675 RepID=A0ABP8NXE6_9NOCA
MSSPTPADRTARTAAATAFGLQGFFLASVLTQLPAIKDRFGFDDTVIVIAVVTVSLVAGVGSVLAERLATRTDSRTTLRVGLGVVVAAGVLLALSHTTVPFFAAFGIYGIGLGMVDAATNMQAVAIQHRYGRSILSSFHAVWSVGAIIGALTVSLASGLDVGLTATILVGAAVVAAGTLRLGPRLHQADGEDPLATMNPVGGVQIPWRPFLMLGAAMALFYAIDFGIGNWSALYLTDMLLSSASTAALAMAAYQGAGLVSRLTGDLWVRRFGETTVVRVGAIIGAIGLLVAVAAPTPAVAIAGFGVAGLGLPVVAPLCFSAAGQLAPPEQTDAIIARLNLFNYAGTVIGGGVVGAVAAATDLRAGFGVLLAFAVVLVVLAPAFHPSRVKAAPAPVDPVG